MEQNFEIKAGLNGCKVTLSQLRQNLTHLVSSGNALEVPAIFLWGPPGIGKSSVVKQLATEKRLSLIDLRLSLLDPVDLRGVPYITNTNNGEKECAWSKPVFIPTQGRGILFLDEINLASPSVQASALQLVLDRRVGEHKLGDGWFVIAAGNRQEDSTLVFDLPKPLLNRFVHFEIVLSLEEWLNWAFQNEIDERIIAFIKFRPDLLYKYSENSNAFPTPRSWEFCSKLLQKGLSPEVASYSTIGPGAGAEFLTYLAIFEKIPDVDRLLEKGEIPELEKLEASVQIAFCTSVVAKAKPDQNHIDNILKLVLELANVSKELGVYTWRGAYLKFKGEIENSPYWVECVKTYRDVIV